MAAPLAYDKDQLDLVVYGRGSLRNLDRRVRRMDRVGLLAEPNLMFRSIETSFSNVIGVVQSHRHDLARSLDGWKQADLLEGYDLCSLSDYPAHIRQGRVPVGNQVDHC